MTPREADKWRRKWEESKLKVSRAKRSDYSGDEDVLSNFKMSEQVGVRPEKAILVRITDKLARIGQLLDKEESSVPDETITDTMLDLANYADLLAMVYENRVKKGNNSFVGRVKNDKGEVVYEAERENPLR